MNTVVQLAPITAEVRERIVQAANTLFAQAGHQTLPTVDQVRRLARTDMNATSAVMRDWRREQAVRAAPAPVQLPDTLAQAHAQAVAALWGHAQQLASDSLLAAQAGWDAERAEIGAIQQQVSGAYDTLAAEFEQFKVQAAAAAQAQVEASTQAAADLAALRAELARALGRAERAESRLDEAERRRDSLAAENERLAADTARLQAQADQAARDLTKANEAAQQAAERHSEQRKLAAAEAHRTVERMTRAEADRDDSRRDAAKARELAARLNGQVEALKEQFAALLRTLGQGGDGGSGGPGQGSSPRRTGP
jgi:hypothetical protein